MNSKTHSSKPGLIVGILVMALGIMTFNTGWLDRYAHTAVEPVSAATVSPETAAPARRGYAPDGSVIFDMGNPNYDTNVAYEARKAEIDHRIASSWAHWREGKRVNELTGEPQAEVFAWDQNAAEDVLWKSYVVGTNESKGPEFMAGPEGKAQVPSFTYIETNGMFRAGIASDAPIDFRFNYDQSIKAVFVFVNEKGVKHTYPIIGYRGESGGVVFLQEQALSIMDLFMTSKSMSVRIPVVGGYKDMKFDCKTFDAKPFLRLNNGLANES